MNLETNNKLTLLEGNSANGFCDITIGDTNSGGVGGFRKKTGPYGQSSSDVMTGNYSGWDGFHRQIDSFNIWGV